MPDKVTDPQKLKGRINEQYIVNQWDMATHVESHREHKVRLEKLKMLYRGDWTKRFNEADASIISTIQGDEPWVENIVKNGIHDLAGLAMEARAAAIFTPQGEGDPQYRKAQIREAIADTIWEANEGSLIERRLYMDVIGAGMAAVAAYKSDDEDYAQFVRLDPQGCYPDVRNGKIQDMLYIETITIRQAQRMYPQLNLKSAEAWCDKTVQIVDYYDKDEVVKALVLTKGGKINARAKNYGAFIVERWAHRLGVVPVAFTCLDTLDGAFRGLYDQAGGPVLARNVIVKYMLDYMDDMINAPLEAKNVINATAPISPGLVYQHDPNSDESFIRRLPPASPAGEIFGLIQYLGEQSSGEAIQPPARQGQVTQSIASASFVAATQGRLTTVITELQSHMASLRHALNIITFKIEEKHLDREKPLVRPVGRKHVYKPAADIDGWYFHRVDFGAAAGLDRGTADVRVLQHLGAQLISRKTAREQIDYVTDPTSEQDRIDLEIVQAARQQRFVADPSLPLSSLVRIELAMAKGKGMIDALELELPEMVRVEEEVRAAGAPAGAPGEPPLPEGAPGPAEEQFALEQGQTPEGGAAPEFAAPVQPIIPQIITRGGV